MRPWICRCGLACRLLFKDDDGHGVWLCRCGGYADITPPARRQPKIDSLGAQRPYNPPPAPEGPLIYWSSPRASRDEPPAS